MRKEAKYTKAGMACSLKARRVDPKKVDYSKNISSVHGKVGQREKDLGNRTIIQQRGIRNELRQEGEE